MEDRNTFRSLGKTDIRISPIGLGCWQFSKQKNLAGKFWPLLDDETISSIVSLSLKNGINWFDTAEIYGGGESERSLSKALQAAGRKPGEIIVATKWNPLFRFSSNIRRTITDRINALSPYPIDLYQIHQPIGFSGIRSEMEAMAELLEKGLIRSIGVSNYSATQMKLAWEVLDKRGIPLASNQVRYNLLDRRIDSNGIIKIAKELGISIIAYSPLAQGLLTGKFHDDPGLLNNIGFRRYNPLFRRGGLDKSLPLVTKLKELGAKYNVTPSQVALNWLINFHGETVLAIPGATKVRQVEENTGALKFRLSDEEMDLLDKESSVFK
jgi:aryl-alcohol dehydrogenase-like predicted oxidoreductase